MPVDPVPESSGTRRPIEESTTTTDGLGGGEQLAPTVGEPAALPRATMGAIGSLEVDARVADTAPESRAKKPVVPKEQAVLPKASEGMVGHAVWPSSPLVVPPATEEDEVEEIKREEARPQAV